MIISVINQPNGKVKDDYLQRVIRAVNRQIEEDFEPYWSSAPPCAWKGAARRRPAS